MENEKKYNKLKVTIEETIIHEYEFDIEDSISFDDERIEKVEKAVVEEFKDNKWFLGQKWNRLSHKSEFFTEDDTEETSWTDDDSYSPIDIHYMGKLEEKDKNSTIEIEEWIKDSKCYGYICPRCNTWVSNEEVQSIKFCPGCEVRMKNIPFELDGIKILNKYMEEKFPENNNESEETAEWLFKSEVLSKSEGSILNSKTYYKCSNCGYSYTPYYIGTRQLFKHCPKCKRRMTNKNATVGVPGIDYPKVCKPEPDEM